MWVRLADFYKTGVDYLMRRTDEKSLIPKLMSNKAGKAAAAFYVRCNSLVLCGIQPHVFLGSILNLGV